MSWTEDVQSCSPRWLMRQVRNDVGRPPIDQDAIAVAVDRLEGVQVGVSARNPSASQDRRTRPRTALQLHEHLRAVRLEVVTGVIGPEDEAGRRCVRGRIVIAPTVLLWTSYDRMMTSADLVFRVEAGTQDSPSAPQQDRGGRRLPSG
jgi:hypothetical protein